MKMIHSCIVNCCANKRTNVQNCDKFVSFFNLPPGNVLRRPDWVEVMQHVTIPPDKQKAKICSVHFTDDSFRNPECAKWQNDSRKNKRRRLVYNAVPTLHLTASSEEPESTVENQQSRAEVSPAPPQLDVVVDPQEISFSTRSSSSERRCAFNEEDNQTSEDEKNPNLPTLSVETMSPRKSERLARRERYHRFITARQGTKRCSTSPNSLNTPPKNYEFKYVSDEGSPARKRWKQFFTENSDEEEATDQVGHDRNIAQIRIQKLSKRINYLQSLVAFYKNSKTQDQAQIEELKAKCASLALDLKNEQDKREEMSVETEEVRKLNNELHDELDSAGLVKTQCIEQQKIMVHSILRSYFTNGQIRCILEQCKEVEWSIDDFAAAISLWSVSPKAYTYLRNKLNFPFPSLSSLQRWVLTEFDISEGFLTNVLTLMREKGKALTTMDKLAVLIFDEMTLTPEICFDSKSEELLGPCSKALVIMVRGLFGDWKQPIYYGFDKPMTKSILNEALSLLDRAGYQVVACTCNIGDKGCWRELGINMSNHFFRHPTIENGFVYAFADVPHLLKLLRDWYVDDGFNLHGCNEQFTHKILHTIVEKSAEFDSCVIHKLTQCVLGARNSMRQAVWPAARIWSRSIAKAVQWGGKHKLFNTTEYNKFSDFILTVNDWFDVHNSRTKYGEHKGVNGYGVDIDNQNRILVLMSSYMESMRVGSRKELMPFQEGVIISNNSLRSLHEYLEEKFPNNYEYLLTRRLQQDVLENFFSHIRDLGTTRDHPSAYDFKHRLRCYILGKHHFEISTNNSRNNEEHMSASCASSTMSAATPIKHSDSPNVATLETGVDDRDIHQTKHEISNISQSCNAVQISNTSTIDNHSEPAYLYEPEMNEDKVLTRELFMHIINLPSDVTTENTEDESQSKYSFDSDPHQGLRVLDEIAEKQKVGEVYQESTSSLDNCIQEAGLAYVAGYVARRVRLEYRHLGESIHDFEKTASHFT